MNALNGVSAIVLAGYLASVMVNGQFTSLFNELRKELGYLEFLAGIFIVKTLMEYPATSEITRLLFIAAAIGAILKIIGTLAVNSASFDDFAAGKIGVLELITKIAQSLNPIPQGA